jgi:hypothetical protein
LIFERMGDHMGIFFSPPEMRIEGRRGWILAGRLPGTVLTYEYINALIQ